MNLTRRLIAFDEASRALPYRDSLDIWTIGIGHNLQANGLPKTVVSSICDRTFLKAPDTDMPWPDCLTFLQRGGPLTDTEIGKLFETDLAENCSWLWSKPWWPQTCEARQAALNDMAFNLGPARAQKFTTFYGLCAAGDWQAAADDLEFKTLVGKELPKRYGRLERILRTGATDGVLA